MEGEGGGRIAKSTFLYISRSSDGYGYGYVVCMMLVDLCEHRYEEADDETHSKCGGTAATDRGGGTRFQ